MPIDAPSLASTDSDGDMDDINNRIRSLADLGIVGRSLTYFEGKEKVQKLEKEFDRYAV